MQYSIVLNLPDLDNFGVIDAIENIVHLYAADVFDEVRDIAPALTVDIMGDRETLDTLA